MMQKIICFYGNDHNTYYLDVNGRVNPMDKNYQIPKIVIDNNCNSISRMGDNIFYTSQHEGFEQLNVLNIPSGKEKKVLTGKKVFIDGLYNCLYFSDSKQQYLNIRTGQSFVKCNMQKYKLLLDTDSFKSDSDGRVIGIAQIKSSKTACILHFDKKSNSLIECTLPRFDGYSSIIEFDFYKDKVFMLVSRYGKLLIQTVDLNSKKIEYISHVMDGIQQSFARISVSKSNKNPYICIYTWEGGVIKYNSPGTIIKHIYNINSNILFNNKDQIVFIDSRNSAKNVSLS